MMMFVEVINLGEVLYPKNILYFIHGTPIRVSSECEENLLTTNNFIIKLLICMDTSLYNSALIVMVCHYILGIRRFYIMTPWTMTSDDRHPFIYTF
jgi:hypothetical protein